MAACSGSSGSCSGSGTRAVVLVLERSPAGALRQHLPRSRRAAPDLGLLHEQAPFPRTPRQPCPHLLQGPRPSPRHCVCVTVEILVAALWGVLVAALGAWLTDLSPWYYALRKPRWQPPDWLFGPAWTVILA